MPIHELSFLFFSAFMALFPVINPIGSGLMINGFLAHLNRAARRRAIRKIIVNYMIICLGTLLVGHFVLVIFGLSIPVIQIAGGILICKTALQWLSDSSAPASDNGAGQVSQATLDQQLFYPITFPITIGAGTMSVIFALMAQASVKGSLLESSIRYAVIVLALAAMALLLLVVLLQSQRIAGRLGTTGTTILNKLIAFFTFGIGINMFLTGVSKVFHLSIF